MSGTHLSISICVSFCINIILDTCAIVFYVWLCLWYVYGQKWRNKQVKSIIMTSHLTTTHFHLTASCHGHTFFALLVLRESYPPVPDWITSKRTSYNTLKVSSLFAWISFWTTTKKKKKKTASHHPPTPNTKRTIMTWNFFNSTSMM